LPIRRRRAAIYPLRLTIRAERDLI
jgi:hypothetical protein